MVGRDCASLTYDPLGRLYQATTSAGTTRFLYDGDRLIAEYSTAGAVQRRYVHGAGIDEPLVWYEGASVSSATRRYLHANQQGSIVAVTGATGGTIQVNVYDAYGVTTAANTGRFQYTGQAAIPQIGLYYYKARFYNPALGRFMQTDPVGYDDDNNLYTYVGNDPLDKTDPTGKCETAATCAADRDTRNFASGKLSDKQLHENQAARAGGVLLGATVVTAAVATVEFVPAAVNGLSDLGIGAELSADVNATRTVSGEIANASKTIAQKVGEAGRDLAGTLAKPDARAELVAKGMAIVSERLTHAELSAASATTRLVAAANEASGAMQSAVNEAAEAAASRWGEISIALDRILR